MEEKYILQYTPENGKFLDIGAHDGVTFSSTRALLLKGWSGVYVEPDPNVLVTLKENTSKFSDIKILEVAIGSQNGSMPWFDSHGDMVGSISAEHAKKWNIKHEGLSVNVITVKELQSQVGSSFDFINIDVEGINWEVFQQFDFNVWRPSCICVEYDDKKEQIQNILIKHGYEIVYASPENIVARSL
jgi:FkbM family methyltransferase